jgi:hypothetical protein
MKLRHLRCYLTVAKELHFASAAERLHQIATRFFEVPLCQQIRRRHEEIYDVGLPAYFTRKISARDIQW